MFGIGGFELFLILLFGFLIFGPDKLPAIAKTVAQALNKFKSAQEEMSKVIKTEVYDPTSDEPFKNPLEALAKVGGEGKKEEKTESFSERKARYDKERAAKLAAEEKKQAAAKAAPAAVPAAKAVTDASKEGAPQASTPQEGAPAAVTASKPKPSADELYGNKPMTKTGAGPAKPATKPAAAKPEAAKPAEPGAKPVADKAVTEEKGA